MRFASRRRSRWVAGLTPLIDVVFLLLVFFMLASRFETESLLPLAVRVTTEADSGTSDVAVLRIDLDASGAVRLEGRLIDPPGLRREFASAVAGARPVRLRPAAETPLQPIVELLALARDSGARDVAIERDAALTTSGG